MREPSWRQAIGKYLKSSNTKTEDKRRLIQIITNSVPVNAFTSKFKHTSNKCDICRHIRTAQGESVAEESLPIQTVGHISGYCPGQQDSITTAHHATWKTLQGGIAETDPKGWNFPSLQDELTIGQLWADNKMDEICTIDALWSKAQDSEMKRPLSQENEEICQATPNPGKTRQKENFLLR